MRVSTMAVALCLCIVNPYISAGGVTQCSGEESAQVTQAVDEIKSWTQVFEIFKRYPQCDDGAIAEGLDDKIVGLLTKDWKSVSDLAVLTAAHPEFERFVLKHIDSLMSPSDARIIVSNARNKCPSGASTVCRGLADKAEHPGQ